MTQNEAQGEIALGEPDLEDDAAKLADFLERGGFIPMEPRP